MSSPDLTPNEWSLVALALESHERAMFERSAFGVADAAHRLRDRIVAATRDDLPDWFSRCESTYDVAGPERRERCAFPALDSQGWHMHGDFHESITWAWGSEEVLAAKDQRRAEAGS